MATTAQDNNAFIECWNAILTPKWLRFRHLLSGNGKILVGPSGEIVREAKAEGQRRLPEIRERLTTLMRAHLRDGGVYLPSSTWLIVARRPASLETSQNQRALWGGSAAVKD